MQSVKNPFYVDPDETKYNAAAAAVVAYMQARPGQADILLSDLLSLPAVAALRVGGQFPDGTRAEVMQRVAVLAGA